MIPHITKGSDLGGLLRYLTGPGRQNEHQNPHVIGGDSFLQAWYGHDELGAQAAAEIAALIRTVKATGARVIFTENAANLRLAQTLARETGARVAPPLYTDALGPKGTAGDTFLKALKYNAETMVRALK